MNNLKNLLYYGEIVKPIMDWDGYYVTNLGRVFSAKKRVEYKTLSGVNYGATIWRELKPFYMGRYKAVTLVEKGKKRKNILIHKLIYEAFNGKYDTHYFKVIYKNGDTENCTLDNLRLDFRNRSRTNLVQYVKHKQLLGALIDYTDEIGTV